MEPYRSNMNNRCNPVRQNINQIGNRNSQMRHFQLGMAYVPMQDWGELYDLEEAHCQGTIFPDLNFIFCGSRGKM